MLHDAVDCLQVWSHLVLPPKQAHFSDKRRPGSSSTADSLRQHSELGYIQHDRCSVLGEVDCETVNLRILMILKQS